MYLQVSWESMDPGQAWLGSLQVQPSQVRSRSLIRAPRLKAQQLFKGALLRKMAEAQENMPNCMPEAYFKLLFEPCLLTSHWPSPK